jgi:hypothetical protein
MKHPLRDTWMNMKQRCSNPRATGYENYGGRGIRVCERWRERKTGFRNFLADMGPKPAPSYTLERIDRNGPYSPENCRWASRRDQLLNTSRTVTFERDGVSYLASEVAERYDINPRVIAERAKAGKPFSEIISRHHLQAGRDHMAEMVAKRAQQQREQTHCKNGHELTGDNVTFRKDGGWRICKRCVADAQSRYRQSRRLKRP